MVFLNASRQIHGTVPPLSHNIPFKVISNSLFITHFTKRHYIFYTPITSHNNPQININSLSFLPIWPCSVELVMDTQPTCRPVCGVTWCHDYYSGYEETDPSASKLSQLAWLEFWSWFRYNLNQGFGYTDRCFMSSPSPSKPMHWCGFLVRLRK
jgi:hypothetical protein